MSVLSDLADGAKRLQALKTEMSELELREEILNLRQLLIDAQSEIMTLQQTIAEHEAAAEVQRQLTEIDGFKYDASEGQPVGLPFCPKCEVAEGGKLFRLTKLSNEYSRCPNCNNTFNAARDGRVHPEEPPIDRLRTDYF